MDFVSSRILFGCSRRVERGFGEVSPHRALIFATILHAGLKNFSDEPRDAFVLLGRVNSDPRGGFFIERDGDVFHGAKYYTEFVYL
jgi:hypothetical protein